MIWVSVPRRSRRLCATAAAFLSLSLSIASASPPAGPRAPQGGGDDPALGAVVARVELEAPQPHRFLVRATVPLPPKTFPRTDGASPFALRDVGGELWPAQTEIVARYPRQDQGADVVEVLATVERPAGVPPGARVAYDVVWWPHAATTVEPTPAVQTLLDEPGAVRLTTRDVFGNRYEADLLADLRLDSAELRRLRDGAEVHQVGTHEWLMPADHADEQVAPLPHMMGAHAYASIRRDEDFLLLDLRIHNAGSGHDPEDPRDDPLNDVFFWDLALELPPGWVLVSAFEDPFLGDPVHMGAATRTAIVEALDDGTMHLMPAQAQFERRLAIAHVGAAHRARAALEEQGLGFVQPGVGDDGLELWSWWAPHTARYYPQKHRLPFLDHLGAENLRGELQGELETYEETLRDGLDGPWPVVDGALGWCHPWGIPDGWLAGGIEIHLFDGLRTAFAASAAGYRMHQLGHRMYTCREPLAMFDVDGRPTCTEGWIVEGPGGPYLPTYMFLWPVLFLGDPFGFGDAPTHQQEEVALLGLEPPYADTLRKYTPTDFDHLIRGTRRAKVLAWLGNDALAKDDLWMYGELSRMSYNLLPQTPSGDAIVTGMLHDRQFVDQHPRDGFTVNRGTGWLIDTVVASYCLGSGEYRDRVYPWFSDLSDLFADGQSECTGTLNVDPNIYWFDGLYRTRQSISQSMLENALWGLRAAVYKGRDDHHYWQLRDVIAASTRSNTLEIFWNEEAHAPWFQAAHGPFDVDLPAFCDHAPEDGLYESDAYQGWCSLGYGYRLTGDPIFLLRAVEMALGDLQHALEDGEVGALENRASFLRIWQEQNGRPR